MSAERESIRLADWLASRTPRPPRELADRLASIAGDEACMHAEIAAALIAKATTILSRLGDDRSSAADLLAADALVTYAMEAAADGGDVDEIARSAMLAIGATVRQ